MSTLLEFSTRRIPSSRHRHVYMMTAWNYQAGVLLGTHVHATRVAAFDELQAMVAEYAPGAVLETYLGEALQ